MSEKLTDVLDCLPPVARGDRVSVPRETYERVRLAIADLAAAEERGRRRGVEERDELRDRMHQTIAFLLSTIASGEKLSDKEEAGIRAMLREGNR